MYMIIVTDKDEKYNFAMGITDWIETVTEY